jgi:tetratricopeptide (TPR) repeat protein
MRRGWEPQQLPPTLEGVLAGRIDMLPLADANVLHTASVIGRRLQLPLLEAVAKDVDDLDASLEALVAGGFLDSVPDAEEYTLVFHHALVQDVAYSRLLRKDRRELHLCVAEVAESLYGAGDDTVDLLARHLYLGGAGPRAVPYLVRAGERARSLFANDEAILHFTRVAELAPDDIEAQLRLGDLYELVGDYEQALQRYEGVRDATQDVRAFHGISATQRKRGRYIDSLAAVDAAFATGALRGQDLIPLWLEGGWTLSVMGRFDQAIDVLLAGLELAPERRDGNVAQLLIQLARSEAVKGLYAEALDHALQAQRICEEQGDLRNLTTALRVVGSVHWYREDFDAAVSALQRGLEVAERVGSAEEIGACLTNLALLFKARKQYDEAISYQRQAIEEFERAGNANGRALAYANLAGAQEEAGLLDEALATCEIAEELATAIRSPQSLAGITNTRACIELKRSNFSRAAELAEDAAERYSELGALPLVSEMLELACEAWEKAGNEGRARACSARAREVSAA